MSPLLGLSFALGVLLVAWSFTESPRQRRPRKRSKIEERGIRAGLNQSQIRIFLTVSILLPTLVFLLVLGVTRAWPVALAVALVVSPLPWAWLNHRIELYSEQLTAAWPDVVDSLLSGVRAGIALPEAVVHLSQSGPEITRPHFAKFAREYRATGRFHDALTAMQNDLADPIADRLFEVLRMAREVGGSELGHLLRDLSAVMRDDARVRGELKARQSWTINAARLAVAAPWVVLVLISTQMDAAATYSTPQGIMVLAFGGLACLGAYAVMRRIGQFEGGRR